MMRSEVVLNESVRPIGACSWSVVDDNPQRLVSCRWAKRSLSGSLRTASFDISSATYACWGVANTDCSACLSELTMHSNNNAGMHAIHLNLLPFVFIAMCKCTALFLIMTLDVKKYLCWPIDYFAPSDMSSSLSPTCR